MMQKQLEERLLAAFRVVHREEQEMTVEMLEMRARKFLNSRPKLTLVAANAGPAGVTALGSSTSKVKY